ncbi:hypothetical protein [Salegentibacter salarius]|uniref:Uncharacterized protein n=1 Tax=Salegentibacter salarius TaxID=435906 RepID=A0A2N0TWR7_9FLAO|nr:hypothetical protein [Salegentibacter salarius]OEY72777.1 hypothetical protein BHS39_11630 [Salegentibacter salarius]PKD19171.1 hypothetical protein APR40_11610 [Salegentibacter salarius]SLK00524.1 hypothetical protein SAMN05660445_02376 [Salegentibacter salarius]
MKKSLFAILSIFLILSCRNQEKVENLSGFIPNDAAIIIQTSNLKQFQQDFNSLSFLKENSLSAKRNIQKDLSFLKYTDSLTESIVSISVPKNAKFIYTIISKQQPNFQLDSIQNKSVQNINAEGLNYQKLNLEGNEFFVSEENTPFIISSSETQLRQILKKENLLKNESFEKAYKAIAPNKTSLILNHNKLENFQQSVFPNLDLENVKNYAGWSAVDLDFTKNGVTFNGLTIQDNKKNHHKILANTGTVDIEFAKIVPENSDGFFALGFQDPETFLQNLKEFRQDSIERPEDRIILNTQEAGIILAEENSLFAIKTLITTEATDLIAGFANLEENYRDYPIYKVSQTDIFNKLFNPFFSPKATDFAAAVDQYLVFADNIPQLRDLIADYVNKNTLANEAYYKDSEKNLAQESSILIAGKTAQLKNKLAEAVSKEFSAEMKNLNLGKHKLAILQLVEEDDFAHIHGSFESQNEQNTSNNKTEEMLSVSLEAELLTEPVLVKNHLNNQMDIAVQDINNTLYLISNKGTIFWKKKLKGQILGKIQQVDLFKNGKFQLAFATPYSIEVLDRNGNTVKPFPLKFKDEITQPLSLFDYDNNRKYRFLITQNDEVFMYDKNGKSVKGFDFRKTNSEILQAPKHLRIQNKDYIIFPEKSGKLNILSRQGEHRIKVKESIDFSKNEWYEFENNFVSTNTEGKLVKVTQNGSVNIEKTDFSENHSITARPNLLVSLSENILKIKGKELSLDYGLYTEPEIFYVNDKYYISLTDLQTQKVFVFDSNAELLPGFPVYGTSEINLNNADIDQRPEFVVKGGDKEVLMYKL